MSKVSKRRALAAAMAIALTTGISAPAFAAGRVDTAGLQSADQTSFDRFIVKYRAGTSAAAQQDNLGRAGKTQGLAVGRVRSLSVGGEVVTTSRGVDRVEAETLMRNIAADPNVEYVEVDRLMKPLKVPNDTQQEVVENRRLSFEPRIR